VLGRLELGQAQTKRGNEGRGSFFPAQSFDTLPPKLEVFSRSHPLCEVAPATHVEEEEEEEEKEDMQMEPEGVFCAMAANLLLYMCPHMYHCMCPHTTMHAILLLI
jgi:hypothetical protein